MKEQFSYGRNFVIARSFEAIYRTRLGEHVLLWESRTPPSGNALFFTVLDGQEIRVGSIHEFIQQHPECISLSIHHTMHVLWNGVSKKAGLDEIYVPDRTGRAYAMIKLRLVIDSAEFETEECSTLADAALELEEIIGSGVEWCLQTCFECDYCSSAFPSPASDRDDLRCFRDDPEAFMEVKRKQKFASAEARFSGHYFVNAFHTCAAWRPLRLPDDVTE